MLIASSLLQRWPRDGGRLYCSAEIGGMLGCPPNVYENARTRLTGKLPPDYRERTLAEDARAHSAEDPFSP